MNNIEALSEQLRSLQITEEASNKYELADIKMLRIPAYEMSNENV